MRLKRATILSVCFFLCFLFAALHQAQGAGPEKIQYNNKEYNLYPAAYEKQPEVPSPFTAADRQEVITAVMKSGKHALIPVTVENGKPLHYSKRVESVLGKDRQLEVCKGDFPTLFKTGLHSEAELEGKEIITGYPVSLITYIGRPDRYSGAGFMATDEDILSVLKGDNRLVTKLGLTHPKMAKPLFHFWNVILKEIELGNWARFWDNIQFILYNGRKVAIKANGTKGWQVSIFQDEIQGSFDFYANTEFSAEEKAFLKEKYPNLSETELAEMEKKLSSIHFSEMSPYYIMRYGFYEGHTSYRSDPLAISFIFGLKRLEEIENAFKGNLYKTLTDHFTGTDN